MGNDNLEIIKKLKQKEKTELAQTLMNEGIWDIEYAPSKLKCKGHAENGKVYTFTLDGDSSTNLNDTIILNTKNGTVNVIVTKIVREEQEDFYLTYEFTENKNGEIRHYTKIPINLTDDEYEYCRKYYENVNNDKKNILLNKIQREIYLLRMFITVVVVIYIVLSIIGYFSFRSLL